MKPTILVDHREKRCDVPNHLDVHAEVKYQSLATGDYELDSVIVERKRLDDFIASLKSERLWTQANRLIRHPKRAMLIIETAGISLSSVNIRKEALQGAMLHLALVCGIAVVRASDAKATAKLIMMASRMHSFHQKPLRSRPSVTRSPKQKAQIAMLRHIPGLGKKKALELIRTFGSMEAIMEAETVDLCSIDGIGQSTAESIQHILHEPEAIYGK